MPSNQQIINDLYAHAEGDRQDMAAYVALFAEGGYLYSVPEGQKYYGADIGRAIGAFNAAFPDVHRERFVTYETGDIIVVELAIGGTHTGALSVGGGTVPPTGRTIDVPCCDVFHLKDEKVTSFHCYLMASVMLQQLGVTGA